MTAQKRSEDKKIRLKRLNRVVTIAQCTLFDENIRNTTIEVMVAKRVPPPLDAIAIYGGSSDAASPK